MPRGQAISWWIGFAACVVGAIGVYVAWTSHEDGDGDVRIAGGDHAGVSAGPEGRPTLAGGGGAPASEAGTMPQPAPVRGEPDPQWKSWLEAFVGKPDKKARPPGYGGSLLMWRLTPPNTVTAEQRRRLIEGIEHLSSQDQVTVLGHVGWRGTIGDARQLATKQPHMTRSTMIAHAVYGGQMLRLLNRVQRERTQPAGKNRAVVAGDLQDGADALQAAIDSTTAYVRERGVFADAAAWGSIGDTIRGLARHRPFAGTDLEHAWVLLGEALLEPLTQDERTARPAPHLAVRLRALEAMQQVPNDGRDLVRHLESWHVVRHRLRTKQRVAPQDLPEILGRLVRLAWHRGSDRVRRDLLAWLTVRHDRSDLSADESIRVRTEVASFASPASPAPAFARATIAAWRERR